MKNRFSYFFVFGFLFLGLHLQAQMEIDGETVYGNEWINYDQEYFKLTVSEDGIYRVTGQELENAGLVLEEAEGRYLQLYYHGQKK